MTLLLYYAPFACSLVPFVALTEAGADFDVHVVDFRQRENHSAGFLALNPRHRVPVLVIDGQPLTENVAILRWIAEQYPERALLPLTGMPAYEALSLLAWCASGIHPTLTPNALPERYCDLPGSAEAVRRCAHKLMHENFSVAETRLAGRDWLLQHFSLCDVYFFWCFRRALKFGIELAAYPACSAHFARMQQRASVQRVNAFEAQALEQLAAAG